MTRSLKALEPGGLSIAMVGTRGVPARYGGFETAVEEVGRRLSSRGHRVVVYRRSSSAEDPGSAYLGMELVTRPAIRHRALETLSHTGASVEHLLRNRTDAVLVFNAANSPWLPLLRAAGLPVATHVDGLEWQRAKWGGIGKTYYRWAETLAVRLSDAIIADAEGIRDYYSRTFGVASRLISYGAPRPATGDLRRLSELGLATDGYHLVVARFEPENNVVLMVEGFRRSAARLPLVVVGAAPYADEYSVAVRHAAGDDPRVRLLGSVWDQDLLDQLYAGATTYLHGHSVGGTNPSLLRAIGAGTATIAYDVGFNREVLREAGRYVATPEDVASRLEEAEGDPAGVRSRGVELARRALDYDWDLVTDAYEELVRDLAERRCVRLRPHRRRTAESAQLEHVKEGR